MASDGDQFKNSKQLWKSFLLYAFGIFLTYSAFGSLLGLQSSVNVIDGLGTITTSVIFSSALVSAVTCTPLLIRKFGAKICLYGCEVTYIIYFLANLYPSYYTMVPGAFLVGIGDSMLWSCMPLLNAYYASQYASISGDARTELHKSKFSGYFGSIFQTSKIAGNLVSYGVLKTLNIEYQNDSISSSFANNDSDFFSGEAKDFSRCGANDCQNEDIVNDSIQQYVPSNNLALYILLGIMCIFSTGAIVIHSVFIPGSVRLFGISAQCGAGTVANLEQKRQKQSHSSHFIDGLRSTFSQMFTVKQFLLAPAIAYAGLDYAFLTSELSRAYTSCVFGVTWVPIHMICYGVSACSVSYVTGKMSKKIPRPGFIVFAVICDLGAWILCFFWIPNPTSQFPILAMYILLGGMQGVWIPVTQATQIIAFPNRLDVAAPIWSFWFMLGIALPFGWSSSLCVTSKIYIQIAMLVISVLGDAAVEWMHYRRDAKTVRVVV